VAEYCSEFPLPVNTGVLLATGRRQGWSAGGGWAIASMLMPVAMTLAASGARLDCPDYALPLALKASLSMALPVSTPPNAMAHASGELTGPIVSPVITAACLRKMRVPQ